ncbi:hypothetical protein, partial [Ornithobacterium rhinotracheale]
CTFRSKQKKRANRPQTLYLSRFRRLFSFSLFCTFHFTPLKLNDSLYNKKILFIPFQGEKENYARFHFEPLGKNDKAFGFPKENIEITLNDTPSDSIVLQLRQKMPNSYKWPQQPTDTLVLIKK